MIDAPTAEAAVSRVRTYQMLECINNSFNGGPFSTMHQFMQYVAVGGTDIIKTPQDTISSFWVIYYIINTKTIR